MNLQTILALLTILTSLMNLAVFIRKKVIARRYARVFSGLGELFRRVNDLHEEMESLVLAKQVSSTAKWPA